MPERTELAEKKSLHHQFDRHGTWRLEVALRLTGLSEWMEENGLMDDAVGERLRRLLAQIRSDKVVVAFVAEFSRGKSELINALFFAGYGRRILPAGAGRTTMCPTELGWEQGVPPGLRLLPIETRRDRRALSEWRTQADAWRQFAFDADDPAQMAGVIEKVTEVQRVPLEEAVALGFCNEDPDALDPPPDADGLVEIPRWRHALINIAHPLLRQGLVILDTPGLNAIGAEPELTVGMIPHAHAVLFILAADAGVTRSDLAIWRDHLATEPQHAHTRLVVLNKIDVLWDALSTPAQIGRQIERQVAGAATQLALPREQVLPVSAQKGLIARIGHDAGLLAASGLSQLEGALGDGILGQRRAVLRSVVAAGLAGLRVDAAHVLEMRRRELNGQLQELLGLRGKNATVIGAMLARVQAEQQEFGAAELAAAAFYSTHARSMRSLLESVGTDALKGEMAHLVDALRRYGVKLGAAAAYADTFSRLRARLEAAREQAGQSRVVLAAAMQQLNTEQGLSLRAPPDPTLSRSLEQLTLIERSHVRHLRLGNALRMLRSGFGEQLIRALSLHLTEVFAAARAELDLWGRNALSQIEAHLRERRQGLERRVQAIERVRNAADSLDERIAEIETGLQDLSRLDARLAELSSYVIKSQHSAKPLFANTERLPL